ncbi:MAG TPA: OmpH family outer membrane protein [bacterium]|nr:OmpH family outer membrane protein [bacterium]
MRSTFKGLAVIALALAASLAPPGRAPAQGAAAPAAPAAAPAPATAPAPAAAAPAPDANLGCKVAFVNLTKVLEQSKQGQVLKKSLDDERDKAFAPLKAKQDELAKLEGQISALTQEIVTKGQVWDDYTMNSKKIELQSMQMKYNNTLQNLQNEKARIAQDLGKKNDAKLKPLEEKLNKVMEEIGSKGGYCVILDVSPPAANMPSFNPILYRNPALDITDQVIAAVDKQ